MTYRLMQATINTQLALADYLCTEPGDSFAQQAWKRLVRTLPVSGAAGLYDIPLANALVRDAIACGWPCNPVRKEVYLQPRNQ